MPITFYRCSHDAGDLNEKFEKLFKKCDILAVEEALGENYNKAKIRLTQLSEKGESSCFVDTPLFKENQYRLESIIANSKKQIEVEKSPISVKEDRTLSDLLDYSFIKYLKGNLEEACDAKLKDSKYLSRLCRRRDIALANQLAELQEKNIEKNILVLVGLGHFGHIELRKKGIKTKQEFPHKPYFFDSSSELERRIIFGLPYTRELIARIFPETFIKDFVESGQNQSRKVREISEKLTYGEIEDLSKYTSEDIWRRNMPQEATVVWLRKKGFKI